MHFPCKVSSIVKLPTFFPLFQASQSVSPLDDSTRDDDTIKPLAGFGFVGWSDLQGCITNSGLTFRHSALDQSSKRPPKDHRLYWWKNRTRKDLLVTSRRSMIDTGERPSKDGMTAWILSIDFAREDSVLYERLMRNPLMRFILSCFLFG